MNSPYFNAIKDLRSRANNIVRLAYFFLSFHYRRSLTNLLLLEQPLKAWKPEEWNPNFFKSSFYLVSEGKVPKPKAEFLESTKCFHKQVCIEF